MLNDRNKLLFHTPHVLYTIDTPI